MMEKIYEKGTSTNVGSYRVYADSGKLYEDSEHENQLLASDALKAFVEGRLQIEVSTDIYMASKITSTGATVYAGGSAYTTKTEA